MIWAERSSHNTSEANLWLNSGLGVNLQEGTRSDNMILSWAARAKSVAWILECCGWMLRRRRSSKTLNPKLSTL